jgi:hypothetical protein
MLRAKKAPFPGLIQASKIVAQLAALSHPVIAKFAVFETRLWPKYPSPEFKVYGEEEILYLVDHYSRAGFFKKLEGQVCLEQWNRLKKFMCSTPQLWKLADDFGELWPRILSRFFDTYEVIRRLICIMLLIAMDNSVILINLARK